MVYGLYVLPGVPTVVRQSSRANLIPASGDQDHTISPSALFALVSRDKNVHRILPPHFVTIAKRPSAEQDPHNKPHISEKQKKNIFDRSL